MRSIALILIFSVCSFGAAAAGGTPGSVSAADASAVQPGYGDVLSGDWGGRRGAMSRQGYDWEIVYKLDLIKKVSPADPKTYVLDNLDIQLALDGEKIAGLKGSSGLLYILSNRGGKPVSQGDHSAGVDNIETPEGANTTKIYQAWIQQAFLDGKLSVLAGLYDLNSEFYATETSSLFIQPIYGIGAEMAGTGQNGPSIFPTTSFAIRARAETAGYYLQAVVLDGVPGDPGNSHGTHVQFNRGDGALDVMEAAMPLGTAKDAHDNKLALGTWRYTARFDDLLDLSVKRVSRGSYALMERTLRYRPDSNEEVINGFIRAGQTDGDTTQFDLSWSTGLVFSGMFAGRDTDKLGIAYAEERNGEKWRIYSGNPVAFEKSMELSYRRRLMPGLELQPVAQYLIRHSSDPAQDKSWWLGLRVQTTL